jgi:hypothetical protein
MSSHQSRRGFLKGGSAAALAGAYAFGTPHSMLAGAMIKNLLRSAQAEAADLISSRYYVNLMLFGGPLRFGFDHWLRTSTSEPNLVFSPTAATSFAYNSTTRVISGGEYRTFDYNGVQVPQLFAGLSAADQATFLGSFLVIRGYGSGMDGHPNNSALQMLPLPGQPSISGLLADHSNKNFQAVQSPARGSGSKFVSANSVGLNVLGTNPLPDLLAPVAASNSLRTLRKNNAAAFGNLRSILNSLTVETQALKIAKSSVDNTLSLLQGNFANYAVEWTPLVAQYKAAIEAGVRSTSLPGINTTLDGSQRIQMISDASLAYQIDGNPNRNPIANGNDVTSCMDIATINNLAGQLALADYCIRNDLSSAIEISNGSLDAIRLAVGSGSTQSQVHDCHQGGTPVTTYMSMMHLNGILAGLLLLQSRLQTAGKWSDTVVHITADFDRSINMAGTRLDHGFNQMISSVFSGVISGGPYVVGNVYNQAAAGEPSMGVAAPISGYAGGTSAPGATMMASTVSQLLGVNSNPWKNVAPSLISLNADGTLTLPFGKGKQV